MTPHDVGLLAVGWLVGVVGTLFGFMVFIRGSRP